MQWQFLREVRAGQEKIKTRKKTVTDGCDCLFHHGILLLRSQPVAGPIWLVDLWEVKGVGIVAPT